MSLTSSKENIGIEETFKVTEIPHAEMYKVFNDTKKQQPAASPLELQEDYKKNYKEELQKKWGADTEHKKFCSCEIASYSSLLDDLMDFIKLKQGIIEKVLKMVISKYPVSAKHNYPYCAGSFNGNDYQWLLENVKLIFECLRDIGSMGDDDVDTEMQHMLPLLEDHQQIWKSFADVASLLWSMWKLSI